MQRTMPYDDRNEETGKFNQRYTDSDFLDAIASIDHEASTREVQNEVGCAHRTAHSRLSKLEDSGEIRSREVGKVMLWSIPGSDEE